MHVTTLQRNVAAAVFVALAAAFVALVTATVTLRYRSPATAIALWPWNGEARGALAGQMMLSGNVDAARSLASVAIRQVPGDAASLRVLGMTRPDAETKGRAFRIMQLATQASRRDLQTNLWLIEYYVAQGDVANTIRYYDYSLKSSAEAEQLLFPVLTSAMSNPDIAAAVKAKLKARPVWTTSFLQHAFAAGDSDKNLIPIVLDMAQDRIGLSADLKRQYAQRLAERGNVAGLDRLAKGLGRPLIEGTAALDKTGDLPPADWRLLPAAGMSVFADPTAGFSFVANQNGPLIERLFHLKPGTYALQLVPQFNEGGDNTRLTWSVTCLPESRPIGVMPDGSQTRLVIPPTDCAYQKLSLSLENDRLADGEEISGAIRNMRIDRVR